MGGSRSPRRNSSRLFLRRQLNEVVTLAEEAIDARAIGERIDTLAAELMQDEAAVPTGMLTPKLADHRLELGRELMRAAPLGRGDLSARAGEPPDS